MVREKAFGLKNHGDLSVPTGRATGAVVNAIEVLGLTVLTGLT